MLITISPAKTLDFGPQRKTKNYTTPEYLRQSRQLIKRLRELEVEHLTELMGISESLAEENYRRYRAWRTPFTPENSKQAVLAFRGDVYEGLAADSWKAADFRFAQAHLRILSGLYGVLRPLDLMQAYRLEMGTRLKTDKGANLYSFWDDTITVALNAQLASVGSDVLINLASQEYFKAVQVKRLRARVITPDFRYRKDGKFTPISFFAKKARGMMSAYILRNRLKDPEQIKQFDIEGYEYQAELSKGDKWMFTRTVD